MTTNPAILQALLLGIRETFLDELPDRCDSFESLILALENAPTDREAFNELYRGVHSLKGSGGTHGLGILTTICHHLENLLTETAVATDTARFDESLASRALAYIDLLRSVEPLARKDNPDFSPVENALDALRLTTRPTLKSGLIAESSSVMARIYQKALVDLPVRMEVTNNGLHALERLMREPFSIAIFGRELMELNGVAVIAALRASQSVNRDIPVVLITSNRDELSPLIRVNAVLPRDQHLAGKLVAVFQPILTG